MKVKIDKAKGKDKTTIYPELSKREKEIILHMTGLDRSKEQYRNYYCSGKGATDYDILCDLVNKGILIRGTKVDWIVGEMFHCTDLGLEIAQIIK